MLRHTLNYTVSAQTLKPLLLVAIEECSLFSVGKWRCSWGLEQKQARRIFCLAGYWQAGPPADNGKHSLMIGV